MSYQHVEALQLYIDKNKKRGVTRAEVAHRLDYTAAVISQYLNRKYEGNVTALDEAVASFLASEEAYVTHTPVISGIAMTSQVEETLGVITYVEQQKSFGIVVGEAGLGKTEAMKEYVRQHRKSAIMLTLDPLKESKTAFVQAVWCALPGFSRNGRASLPSAAFLMEEIVENLKGKHKTLIVDEAQFLNTKALETARSLQDKTDIGVVLGGTFGLDKEIGFSGHRILNEQLHSRVKVYRRLDAKITADDVRAVLSLYQIDDDEVLAWFIKRCNRPGRRYRWICAILKSAYSLCVDQKTSLNVTAIEQAEGLTGLY